ncbi:hypothetical protein [Vibrio vulnificus]|uniref:hypothetical protein n=1 Tax=Vibrio vulnificus TaxID=672 RepID=UPI001CCAD2DB|nr:hypothetical protein [Vibrio vulnificus]
MPEAAFGNALTATDNDESETNNTGNEAIKTSHGARYTMGPRFREDDEVRELIRTTSNTNNKVPKPSHGARYPMVSHVREDDGDRINGKSSVANPRNGERRQITPAPIRMAI